MSAVKLEHFNFSLYFVGLGVGLAVWVIGYSVGQIWKMFQSIADA